MNNELAFPIYPKPDNCTNIKGAFGMTLRDYFAAKALTGFIFITKGGEAPEEIAKYCYMASDAMLKEREKKIE